MCHYENYELDAYFSVQIFCDAIQILVCAGTLGLLASREGLKNASFVTVAVPMLGILGQIFGILFVVYFQILKD